MEFPVVKVNPMFNWWVPIVATCSGVVLGFAAAEVRDFFARKRQKIGHLEALAAEIRICGAIAAGYLKSDILSPAYRMPAIAQESSLPNVLSDSELLPEERDALTRYYGNVAAFNRCLDYSHDALIDRRKGTDEKRIDSQVRRARLKANKLAPGSGRRTQYDDVMAIFKTRLPPRSLGPLDFDSEEEPWA